MRCNYNAFLMIPNCEAARMHVSDWADSMRQDECRAGNPVSWGYFRDLKEPLSLAQVGQPRSGQ